MGHMGYSFDSPFAFKGERSILQSKDLEIDTMRLPVNGSYKQEVRNNDAMLYDTDWEHNTLELYNFIYA